MMVSFYYILMVFFSPQALEILAPIGKIKRNLFDLFQDLRDIYAFTEIKNVNL